MSAVFVGDSVGVKTDAHQKLAYASLVAHDYQFGANVLDDADLTAWLQRTG